MSDPFFYNIGKILIIFSFYFIVISVASHFAPNPAAYNLSYLFFAIGGTICIVSGGDKK